MGKAVADLAWAELLWVDRLGCYLRAAEHGATEATTLRVRFGRSVEDERETRSLLTMMSQVRPACCAP